jgi:hypothetical protein
MTSSPSFPLARPLLRYQADWRSLFFLILLTFCFAVEWTGFCRSWLVWLLTCFLTIVACNVKHNHMHCRTFHSTTLNRLLNYWLGFSTGTTTTEILTEHNERHHGHINEEIDYVRATLVDFRSQFLNVLLFFPRAFIRLKLTKPSDLKRWRRTNRRLFWQSLSEKVDTESDGMGTGFKFWDPTDRALFFTIGWAVSTYFDRPAHFLSMQRRGMQKDFKWTTSAKSYEDVYERAIACHV